MDKPFRSIEQQVRLLQGRRVITDDQTPTILLREGYYAIVNGYGKAFLDAEASARARDDRYLPGTTFASMHRLFLFDRELRATTFRAIMSVEGTLRSLLAHTFCERHPEPEAYLNRSSYSTRDEYLRGASYAGDLEWMINTLQHHANGHATVGDDETPDDRDPSSDNTRIAWYRANYDAIPLWVLFSDLTFGNLRYFYALMRRGEQKLVCKRLGKVCDARRMSPAEMLTDLETLSALRNDCAHVERIYDGRFGAADLTYPQVLVLLADYLAEDDERMLMEAVRDLVRSHVAADAAVARELARSGMTQVLEG